MVERREQRDDVRVEAEHQADLSNFCPLFVVLNPVPARRHQHVALWLCDQSEVQYDQHVTSHIFKASDNNLS